MRKTEDMEVLAPEQYRRHALKAADTHALDTGLFYDLVLLNPTPATSIFTDLVFNYDLVLHRIDYISLHGVDATK